jgi:cytochrome c
MAATLAWLLAANPDFEKTFAHYIKDPKAAMPGTKMGFAGINDEDDIRNLIAYLRTFGADGRQAK